MDKTYINKQLQVFKNSFLSQATRLDALWRIASANDLTRHPSTLDQQEQQRTIAWLRQKGFQV